MGTSKAGLYPAAAPSERLSRLVFLPRHAIDSRCSSSLQGVEALPPRLTSERAADGTREAVIRNNASSIRVIIQN